MRLLNTLRLAAAGLATRIYPPSKWNNITRKKRVKRNKLTLGKVTLSPLSGHEKKKKKECSNTRVILWLKQKRRRKNKMKMEKDDGQCPFFFADSSLAPACLVLVSLPSCGFCWREKSQLYIYIHTLYNVKYKTIHKRKHIHDSEWSQSYFKQFISQFFCVFLLRTVHTVHFCCWLYLDDRLESR